MEGLETVSQSIILGQHGRINVDKGGNLWSLTLEGRMGSRPQHQPMEQEPWLGPVVIT
jgi:hypothetical protein